MFGYSRLFRSRWNALLWAVGIVWSVYWFAAPDADPAANNQAAQTDATGAVFNDADVAALRESLDRMGNQ
jgi:hypothetical protein